MENKNMDNLKFNIDGYCINGNAATASLKEFLGRKGFVIDFNNKTIKQVGENTLSQWTIDYINKTYVDFNIADYTVIKDNTLNIADYAIEFDFDNNLFKVNNKAIKVEKHDDVNKPILRVLKTKLVAYDGMQGLVKIFTDGFHSQYSLIEFLKKVA
jgi:hypothetical protein